MWGGMHMHYGQKSEDNLSCHSADTVYLGFVFGVSVECTQPHPASLHVGSRDHLRSLSLQGEGFTDRAISPALNIHSIIWCGGEVPGNPDTLSLRTIYRVSLSQGLSRAWNSPSSSWEGSKPATFYSRRARNCHSRDNTDLAGFLACWPRPSLEAEDRLSASEQKRSGSLAYRGLSDNPGALYLGLGILTWSLQRQVESLIFSEPLGGVGCLNQVSRDGEGGGK